MSRERQAEFPESSTGFWFPMLFVFPYFPNWSFGGADRVRCGESASFSEVTRHDHQASRSFSWDDGVATLTFVLGGALPLLHCSFLCVHITF